MILIIVGGLLVIAKILKAGKVAVKLGLVVIVVWLALYFTGYDKILKRIIFEAPPIEPARPEDLRYR